MSIENQENEILKVGGEIPVNPYYNKGRRVLAPLEANRKVRREEARELQERIGKKLPGNIHGYVTRVGIPFSVLEMSKARNEGKLLVLGDIESYFPSIDQKREAKILKKFQVDFTPPNLVHSKTKEPIHYRGLVTGDNLSPILGAAYMMPLMNRLSKKFKKVFCYADDIFAVVSSEAEGRAFRKYLEECLKKHSYEKVRLKLSQKVHKKLKTIKSDEEFEFGGIRFIPGETLPMPLKSAAHYSSMMKSLLRICLENKKCGEVGEIRKELVNLFPITTSFNDDLITVNCQKSHHLDATDPNWQKTIDNQDYQTFHHRDHYYYPQGVNERMAEFKVQFEDLFIPSLGFRGWSWGGVSFDDDSPIVTMRTNQQVLQRCLVMAEMDNDTSHLNELFEKQKNVANSEDERKNNYPAFNAFSRELAARFFGFLPCITLSEVYPHPKMLKSYEEGEDAKRLYFNQLRAVNKWTYFEELIHLERYDGRFYRNFCGNLGSLRSCLGLCFNGLRFSRSNLGFHFSRAALLPILQNLGDYNRLRFPELDIQTQRFLIFDIDFLITRFFACDLSRAFF